MSNYKVGDIIRLTRISQGMTQEELCTNICSVQTLHRIENGKSAVKKDVYQQLMERMGRNGEKSFTAICVEDFELLDDMAELNTLLAKHEYEKVDKKIQQLKPKLKNNVINMQYIGKTEIVTNYRLGRITEKEYVKQLEKMINLSIPNYRKLLDTVFPFMDEEIIMLMNIASAYRENEQHKEAIKILRMLIRSLDTGYMDEKNAVHLKTILMNNMAKAYGELYEHQTAIEICEKAIAMAKDRKIIHILSNLYFELAWNIIQQIETGERAKEELALGKIYLRQGYAAAVISKKYVLKIAIGKYYREYFGKDIYCLSSSRFGEPSN